MASRGLLSGCQTFEVVQKDAAGEHTILPVSGALASAGREARQPVTKMKIVQQIGWPRAMHDLRDDQGKALIVKKDDTIYLLKCKPSCWRLYFYVSESGKEKSIIYVHAVCKKKDKENARDAIRAKRVADAIRAGQCSITPFEFPSG